MEQLDRAHATIAHLAGQPLPTTDVTLQAPLPDPEPTYAVPEQYPDGEWE